MAHGMILQHVLDAQQQLAQMKWLGNELFGADLKTFQPMLGSAQRGDEHYRQ